MPNVPSYGSKRQEKQHMGQLDGLAQVERWPTSGGATCLLEPERPGHEADPDENLESRSEPMKRGAQVKRSRVQLCMQVLAIITCAASAESAASAPPTQQELKSNSSGLAEHRVGVTCMRWRREESWKRCWASRLALDKDRRATGTHGRLR